VRRSWSIGSVGAPLAALGAAALLAGCGGSHGPTKQQVVARANAICFASLQSIRAVPGPTAADPSFSNRKFLTAFGRYADRVTPIIDGEVAKLRDLPRPAQDVHTLNGFITAMSKERADYHALATAATRGDTAAFSDAVASLRASPAARLAHAYGLTQCTGAAGTSSSTG
jgi:hypothetical protein